MSKRLARALELMVRMHYRYRPAVDGGLGLPYTMENCDADVIRAQERNIMRVAAETLVAEGLTHFEGVVADLKKEMHRENRRITSASVLYTSVCAVVGTDDAEQFGD
jgi:hypothetical protein